MYLETLKYAKLRIFEESFYSKVIHDFLDSEI